MGCIVHSCESFVIALKPHGLPTVPLRDSKEDSLLALVEREYPETGSVAGRKKIEGGAVHRLDTATGGLVLFARTQAFMDWILDIQERGLFSKTYKAVCDEAAPDASFKVNANRDSIESWFRSYGRGGTQVRPVVDVKRSDNKKLYKTYIEKIENTYVCTISSGFRHQIRTHLAAIGHPICGDRLYNPLSKEGETMRLDCIGLSFPMPDGTVFNFRTE